MSEFECKNGHQMLPSQGPFCKICGGKVFKMDGRTDRELEKEEEFAESILRREARKVREYGK